MKLKSGVSVNENGFLFDPNTGESYSVNSTAKEILRLMVQDKDEDEIISEIEQHFNADRLTIERNLYEFISLLKIYSLTI